MNTRRWRNTPTDYKRSWRNPWLAERLSDSSHGFSYQRKERMRYLSNPYTPHFTFPFYFLVSTVRMVNNYSLFAASSALSLLRVSFIFPQVLFRPSTHSNLLTPGIWLQFVHLPIFTNQSFSRSSGRRYKNHRSGTKKIKTRDRRSQGQSKIYNLWYY
jgi:hypothetical protein